MNPLIEHRGVCDPHIHIFEGKAYLYATHDNYRKLGEGFQMTEWQIWSSEDLVHWKLERVENPRDYYCGPIDQCWAVDAAYRDGKYYWYFSEGAIKPYRIFLSSIYFKIISTQPSNPNWLLSRQR